MTIAVKIRVSKDHRASLLTFCPYPLSLSPIKHPLCNLTFITTIEELVYDVIITRGSL